MATDNKYDRQLRLWGPSGQKRLAQSRILVLGAGPVGSETLKNIVLPGCCAAYIGGFATIVDDRLVELADVGNNFFVTTDSVGRPIAETVAANLRELNDECDLRVLNQSPASAAVDEALLLSHSLVIVAAPLKRDESIKLDSVCRTHRIPCIFARAYGLAGEVRASYAEHVILNSRSILVRTHLHVLSPFEELRSYIASINLESIAWGDLVKLPCLTLIAKAVDVLRESSDRVNPTATEVIAYLDGVFEKATKAQNAAARRVWEEKAAHAEESGKPAPSEPIPESGYTDNLLEVRSQAPRLVVPFSVEDKVEQIFNDKRSNGLDSCPTELLEANWEKSGEIQKRLIADEYKLWLGFSALKEFYKQSGCLPVNGEVPDMESSTKYYNEIKRVYASKAANDRKLFSDILHSLNVKASQLDGIAMEAVSMLEWTASEISDLCKNCGHLAVAKTTSLENEFAGNKFKEAGSFQRGILSEWFVGWEDESAITGPNAPVPGDPQAPIIWYLLLRAADKFYDECGYYPGYTDDTLESDVQSMRKFVDSVLDDFGLPSHLVSSAHVQEICRFGAAELHTEAAFVGGAAAQTVTILVSRQFVPIEGVLVHNGINGSSQMLELFD